MENYIIISKLAILVYSIMRFSEGINSKGSGDAFFIPAVVIFSLVYISLNMALYITNRNKVRRILLIISIIIILGSFRFINHIFVLLLPINIFEFMLMLTDNLWLPSIVIELPLFAIQGGFVAEYIMVSILSYIIYLITYKYYLRVQSMSKENDSMRIKIHELSLRLNKEAEYEHQVRYSSQLEERNKIAQEIHDRIGHILSGAIIQLEAANIFIEKDAAKSRDIIQRVIDILRDGTEGIRATLKNIKPEVKQMGVNRIKLMLDEFTIKSNIKGILFYSGNIENISHVQWKVIYDNIKEALTNIIKYSYATEVRVNIQVLSKFVKMEIKDNGIGTAAFKKGMGITGMEERVSSMRGQVIIDGSDGFSIISLLPFEVEV